MYVSNWAGVCLYKAEVAMVHLDTIEKDQSSWVAASSKQCAVCGVERLLAVTLKTVTFTLPRPGLRPTC